jgi:hypothetical protein
VRAAGREISRALTARAVDLAALTEGFLGGRREAPRLTCTAFFLFIIDPLKSLLILRLTPSDHRAQGSAPEKVHMQVIHLLTAVCIAIDNQAVAAFGNALLPRKIARHEKHVADEPFILVGDVIGGRNWLVWDYQYMYRSRWSNVQERDHSRVTVEHCRRQITRDYFLKKRSHFIRLR